MRIGLSDRFQEQTGFFDITKRGEKQEEKFPACWETILLNQHVLRHTVTVTSNFSHIGDTNYILPKQAYKYTLTQRDHSENQLSI